MRVFLLFFFFPFMVSVGFCQSEEFYLIKYQKIAFITPSSEFFITKFLDPKGAYFFREGYTNPDSTYRSYVLDSKGNRYVRNYFEISTTDTVFCFFPLTTNSIGLDYLFPEFLGSYILRQVGESCIAGQEQDIIRIIVPCDELNFSYNYHIVTIVFEGEMAMIYLSTCQSSDYFGYQMVKRDSLALGNRDIRRVRKLLAGIEGIDSKDCRTNSGSPMVIETNINGHYRRSTIFYPCFFRSRDKDLNRLVSFLHAIQGVGLKSFKMDCRIELKQRKERWPPPTYYD